MGKIQGKIFEIEGEEYKIIEPLGSGGNGDVWRAESNDREYAIKIINKDQKDKKDRFNKEALFCKNNYIFIMFCCFSRFISLFLQRIDNQTCTFDH